jgi:hypothetical protein
MIPVWCLFGCSLFCGPLLGPFPATASARVIPLVQRRVQLGFSVDGEAGLTGDYTLMRDIRDGGELPRACPNAPLSRCSIGRGRDHVGS